MGSRLDLRQMVEVVETAADDPSVHTERHRSIERATGRLYQLVAASDPEARFDRLDRDPIQWAFHDIDDNGDGDYLYASLSPGWYEARSRGSRHTAQRIVFRVDRDGFPEVIREVDFDHDRVLCGVLGIDPDQLAEARVEVDGRRLAEARAEGLPPLVGTPKQVRFALAIRRARLAEARPLVEAERPDNPEFPGPIERALVEVKESNSAEWWIHFRTWPIADLLASVEEPAPENRRA